MSFIVYHVLGGGGRKVITLLRYRYICIYKLIAILLSFACSFCVNIFFVFVFK